MSIPSYDFLSKPTDDEKMKYNYDENRYIPLVDGITKDAYVNLVIDWGSKKNAQSYLDLLSRVVMETILSFKDQKYRNEMLYYLSHSSEARTILYQIFCDTIWYNRRDGGFMMAYNSGANLNQGKLIEFGIDKALSPIAKQICKNTIFGTKHIKYDINEKQEFDDLETLLEYLVAQGYMTEEESADIEDYIEIPDNNDYYIIQLADDTFLYTYMNTLDEAIQNMKRYNTSTGDW